MSQSWHEVPKKSGIFLKNTKCAIFCFKKNRHLKKTDRHLTSKIATVAINRHFWAHWKSITVSSRKKIEQKRKRFWFLLIGRGGYTMCVCVCSFHENSMAITINHYYHWKKICVKFHEFFSWENCQVIEIIVKVNWRRKCLRV